MARRVRVAEQILEQNKWERNTFVCCVGAVHARPTAARANMGRGARILVWEMQRGFRRYHKESSIS